MEHFTLAVKGSECGEVKTFSLVSERDLKHVVKNQRLAAYDMNKLEVEYDYDTDQEQVT
jgi:hypothetical protein